MTVAVGFVYDDGLVFCVDTKISTPMKTMESKLVWYSYAEGQCALAYILSADDLGVAKTAVESCNEAVNRIDFTDQTVSVETVRKTVQSALAKFCKEHVFPRLGAGASIDFEFLMGVWFNNQTRMFASRQTVLEPINEYECLGSGSYLAKYLIRQFRTANPGAMSLADAALIASYAVEQAIEYDQSCGGEPDFLIMRNSGECGNGYETASYPSTDLAASFQTETWKLLHDLANAKGDLRSETAAMINRSLDRLRTINATHNHTFDWRSKNPIQ